MTGKHSSPFLVTAFAAVACNALYYNSLPDGLSATGTGGETTVGPSPGTSGSTATPETTNNETVGASSNGTFGSTTGESVDVTGTTLGDLSTSANDISTNSTSGLFTTTETMSTSTTGGISCMPNYEDPCSVDDHDKKDDGCHEGQRSRIVFLTSEMYAGDLGGPEGADEKCSTLAANAGLVGEFRAWISGWRDGVLSTPALRMAGSPMGQYRLIRLDGQIVAASWSDFTEGWLIGDLYDPNKKLSSRIRVTEVGEVLEFQGNVSPYIWSGTGPSGNTDEVWLPGVSCSNWTTDVGVVAWGHVGNVDGIDYRWSNADGQVFSCETSHRLVCIQYSLCPPP